MSEDVLASVIAVDRSPGDADQVRDFLTLVVIYWYHSGLTKYADRVCDIKQKI
jgi:hypothetical protein